MAISDSVDQKTIPDFKTVGKSPVVKLIYCARHLKLEKSEVTSNYECHTFNATISMH